MLTDDKEYPKCIVRKQQKKYVPEKLQCTYMTLYKKYGGKNTIGESNPWGRQPSPIPLKKTKTKINNIARKNNNTQKPYS